MWVYVNNYYIRILSWLHNMRHNDPQVINYTTVDLATIIAAYYTYY